jgi:DNA-binding NarL/FixJ family response regulator
MPTYVTLHHRALPFAEEPGNQAHDCFVLTRRQREVAALVARGASNREIGYALYLSERSVETYVSAILGRLGLRSRTQVAVWAVQRGLPVLAGRESRV